MLYGHAQLKGLENRTVLCDKHSLRIVQTFHQLPSLFISQEKAEGGESVPVHGAAADNGNAVKSGSGRTAVPGGEDVMIENAVLLKVPLIISGGDDREIIDLQNKRVVAGLGKRLLDAHPKGGFVRPAPDGAHVSAEVDNGACHAFGEKILSHAVRNIALCDKTKIQTALRIFQGNLAAIDPDIFVIYMGERLPDSLYVGLGEGGFEKQERFLMDGNRPAAAVIDVPDIAALHGPAEKFLIICGELHAAV